MKQEEILSFFKVRASEIIYKYSISESAAGYNNQHLRMSSYFGQFNENMMLLEKELNTEKANILADFLDDDIDIPSVIDEMCAYTKHAKLQYITRTHP